VRRAFAVVVALLLTSSCSGGAAKKPLAWDARVLPLVKFVEKERGLTFKRTVPVKFLNDKDFQRQVAVPAPETKKDKAELEVLVGALRAVGLIRGKVDITKQLDTLYKSQIIGLYVPNKKSVFVRGEQLTPYARVTLVHELTHVLQDQYFDLTKIKEDAPNDDTTAVTALIEGDAVRVQQAYQAKLSTSDTAQFAKEAKAFTDQGGASSQVPAYLSDSLTFPYVFGPVLLKALEQKGGNKAIDNAFRLPPSEEAQVLDPAKHPIGENPRTLKAPSIPAGGTKPGKRSSFGQVTLFMVLGSRIPYAEALSAVSGWAGDTYRPYSNDGLSCLAIDVEMAGAGSASTLSSAFDDWRRTVPTAHIATSGKLVSIRSCDPGSKAAPLSTAKPSAFDVLSARAQIIGAFLTQGAPFAKAACVADQLIEQLGTRRYSDLTAQTLEPDELKVVQDLSRQAAVSCANQP
jgi:hypothetical protein